jgi:hypothetical protein
MDRTEEVAQIFGITNTLLSNHRIDEDIKVTSLVGFLNDYTKEKEAAVYFCSNFYDSVNRNLRSVHKELHPLCVILFECRVGKTLKNRNAMNCYELLLPRKYSGFSLNECKKCVIHLFLSLGNHDN